MRPDKNKILIVLAFIAIYVVWGSTYLWNKVAVTELPPFFLAFIRFFTAGTLILILAKVLKKSLKITRKELLNSAIAGFFFLVYGNSVFVWGLKYVDSGFAALLASTQPLFILILLRLIDRKPLQKKSIIGVTLGVIGMYLLISQKEITTTEDSVLGIFMIFTCVLSWSYGSVFVSKAVVPKNFFVSTGYQMFLAGIMLLICSFIFKEEWTSPIHWANEVQISMILLIFLGSIVAFTAFNYLLKVVPTEKVATSAYVNPVIAMLLGWHFLGEVITQQSIIASLVLLTGVYFINARKRR